MGLSLEDWRESPKYWCEAYAEELDEEMAYMMDDLKHEFAL